MIIRCVLCGGRYEAAEGAAGPALGRFCSPECESRALKALRLSVARLVPPPPPPPPKGTHK